MGTNALTTGTSVLFYRYTKSFKMFWFCVYFFLFWIFFVYSRKQAYNFSCKFVSLFSTNFHVKTTVSTFNFFHDRSFTVKKKGTA